MRFLFGVVCALVAVAGALYGWSRRAPCFDRCGDGTRCVAAVCVPATAAAAAPAPTVKAPGRRRHGATRGGLAAAAPEATLAPGDDKMVAQGDAVGRPERVDFTQAGDDGKELSQDDLDAVVKPAWPAIERCITTALGDVPLDTGRVEVSFRVEKTGAVSRVRVAAPAVLQRNKLTPCVRAVVTALRFPASGGAAVATYPFELR